MIDSQGHWNKVFSQSKDSELGWFEPDVAQTLKFIDMIPASTKSATIFLPGAGTSILVDQLLESGFHVVLNDISSEALNRLEKRVERNKRLIWLLHDISKPLPEGSPKADIWIDRAVLHFLLDESQIEIYFSNLNATLLPGGYVLLAEFSSSGSKKCAGLDVHRYSLAEMTQRIGGGFELIAHEDYSFISPSGNERPYIYALYRKRLC